MMYPFLTLDDNTEIVYSQVLHDGRIKVYLEKPDPDCCFRYATCYLPEYSWENVSGFSPLDINRYQKVIQSNSVLIQSLSALKTERDSCASGE